MSADNALTLLVGGQIYGGWKSVNIPTGIEQLAGGFELAITERWPNQPVDWNIPPGERCMVMIGDDTVITGYVDAVTVTYDANTHDIKVTGRDAAGDLVDCSAPSESFSGLTYAQIAERICKPFGIEVYDETQLGKKLTLKQKKAGKKGTPPKKRRLSSALPKHAIQNGESIFRTLEKLGRSEGVLLVSDGEGGLVITRAGLGGDADTMLEFGKNILRANFEQSHANLFSEITVKGQISAAGAGKYDVTAAHPKATVTRKAAPVIKSGNTQITRYRPLIILAETQADAKRCQQRAQWEASNREAKARKITVTVQGWRQNSGDLWRINQMVKVVCPWMRVNEVWLIAGVNYKLDESGTLCDLMLTSDKAFDMLPDIPAPALGADAGKYKVTGAVK
jgi:prophage tail gpP-like protein